MLRLTAFGRLGIEWDATAPRPEVRPQRLALLAILAAVGPRGISRDRVLAILWPESEPERARHSLSQTLYGLRRDLGTEVVLVTPNMHLDPATMTSDVNDFRSAVTDKNWERAAALFTGPFLDGFYLAEAAEFERWAEEERSSTSHDALRAIEAAARRAAELDIAIDYWRRLTKLDPVNGRFAAGCVDALLQSGDRPAALMQAQAHADLVRRELEVEPDAEILRLLESLRDVKVPAIRTRTPVAAAPSPLASFSPSPQIRVVESRQSLRYWWAAIAVLVIIIGGALFTRRRVVGRADARDGVMLVGSAVNTPSQPRSPLAVRAYEDGLRAFYQFDAPTASRLFVASLKEDPTFAMAAYYAWRSAIGASEALQDSLAARANLLAMRAPERDRLLILSHLAAANWSLSAIPLAESLATRFPNDGEALRRAAEIANDLSRSTTLINRAIELDSAAGAGSASLCRVCEEFHFLARRLESADSVKGVEQTLDRWTALRRGDYQPWQVRADYMIALGRRRDAEAALRRADSLGAPHVESAEAALLLALRLDDVDSANVICREKLSATAIDTFAQYRWPCTIAWRMQGRDHDALALVLEGRVPWSNIVRTGLPRDRVHLAILDMDMGRPTAAAVQYDRLASEVARSSGPEGTIARNLAWQLTLSATASALARDTVRVRALADSVEVIGRRSLYARDPLLHHFLRGLVLSAAGQHEQAVREFRAAISSPSLGFTRVNYEMGKSLLALKRPADAIPIVRAALHGGLDGSGLYVTRTELHELLAQAFAEAGSRDSATAHYAVVERSWRAADPMFGERYYAARQWLLRSSRSGR